MMMRELQKSLQESLVYNFIYTILIAIVSFLTFIATSPFLFGGLNYFYNEVKDIKIKETYKVGLNLNIF